MKSQDEIDEENTACEIIFWYWIMPFITLAIVIVAILK